MVASNFPACLAIILREEGGNDDDPNDHGGRTSRGIIQREWDTFRKTHKGRPADVWKASDKDVATIYKDQYWAPWCDDMPSGVDLLFFNASVNSGRTQATKELQRALGVNVDGMMGMITKQALTDAKDVKALIKRISDYRRKFYRALAQFPRYGKGWMSRTDRVQLAAVALAGKKTAARIEKETDAAPTVETVGSAKSDPKAPVAPLVSKETGAAVATSSSVSTGLVDQVQSATTPLTPFADTLTVVKYILIAVAVVSFAFTIYAIWKDHKTKAAIG